MPRPMPCTACCKGLTVKTRFEAGERTCVDRPGSFVIDLLVASDVLCFSGTFFAGGDGGLLLYQFETSESIVASDKGSWACRDSFIVG